MKCCIKTCKSYSDKHLHGITFHLFPTDIKRKEKWLRNISREKWLPKKHTRICSLHFNKEDFIVTAGGCRKLRKEAAPCLNLNLQLQAYATVPCDVDCSLPPKICPDEICSICLAIDRKLFDIDMYSLRRIYEEIIGEQLGDSFPLSACWECARRMQLRAEFDRKVIKSRHVLMDVLQNYTLTPQIIQKNRASNNLASNLSIVNVDQYDRKHYFNYTKDDDAVSFSMFEVVNDNKIEEECDSVELVKIKAEIHTDSDATHFSEDRMDDVGDGIDDVGDGMDNVEGEINNTRVIAFNPAITDVVKLENSPKFDDNSDGNLEKELDLNTDPVTDDATNDLVGNYTIVNENGDSSSDADKLKAKLSDKRKENVTKKFESFKRNPMLYKPLDNTIIEQLLLSHEESLRELEQRKQSDNYIRAKFKCEDCFKGYNDENAYDKHRIKHTNRYGCHVCHICQLHYGSRRQLYKHVVTHQRKFVCKCCPYVTHARMSAKYHVKYHKGVQYNCPVCGQSFNKQNSLLGHLRKKHSPEHVCNLCGQSYVTNRGLTLHKEYMHKFDDKKVSEESPRCDVCEIGFATWEALGKHKQLTHNFKRKRRNAQKPVQCEQCELELPNPRMYASHFRRAHPDKIRAQCRTTSKPSMCEVCGKMFQNNTLLRYHNLVHTGRGCQCVVCGKYYRGQSSLSIHMRSHRDRDSGKTYACPVCDKRFSFRGNMMRHTQIHSVVKSHRCETCGKCFKTANTKQAHVTFVHVRKAWPKRKQKTVRSEGSGSASETESCIRFAPAIPTPKPNGNPITPLQGLIKPLPKRKQVSK